MSLFLKQSFVSSGFNKEVRNILNHKVICFSFVSVMLRLERLGHRHLERKLGEEDEIYLLRTKVAFPGMFDDMIAKEKLGPPIAIKKK